MLSAGKRLNVRFDNMEGNVMIKFIIGMMIGGTVGFITAALLAAAKRGDSNEV